MHSKIFQIGLKPISKEDYLSPEELYDNHSDFADYIGDEFTGADRVEAIESIAECLPELFDYIGDGTLLYKGMGTFLQDWADDIKRKSEDITCENILHGLHRYSLTESIDKTHKGLFYRFYTIGWDEYPEPMGEFVAFISTLKEGTRLYVGAVIDFHF